MKKLLLLTVALVSLLGIQRSPALTIIRDFGQMGIAPTNSTGGGDPIKIINTVCDRWEKTILDPATIVIHFKWGPVGGGQHVLNAQGGIPDREKEGTVSLNNDNDPSHFSWYLTPNPEICFEATGYSQQSANIGGKIINATRCLSWPTTGPQMDFYTAVSHEVGHALGLSFGNYTFQTESIDGYINITSGMYTGMAVLLQTNNAGLVSHIWYYTSRPLMTGSWAPGERVFPSVLDIMVLAQLCGFKQLNLDLLPELRISKHQGGSVAQLDLSWTPVVPAPTGMRYAVKSRSNPQSGAWTTVNCPVTSTNGVYTMTVPMGQAPTYFTLTTEPVPGGGGAGLVLQSTPSLPSVSLTGKILQSLDPEGD